MNAWKFHWSVVGHQSQKGFLKQALRQGRLAQTYLFVGPAFVGKTALAYDFAKILICQNQKIRPCGNCPACSLPETVNPDFVLLDQEGEIRIEQIRRLRARFSLKSFANSKKVAIIANAENLNQEAANALLKFLEEPHPGTFIILTSIQLGRLPATIGSRAQKIYFGLATRSDCRHFFSPRKVSKQEEDELVRISFGRLGLTKRFLDSKEFFEQWQDNLGVLDKLLQLPLSDRLLDAPAVASLDSEEILRIFLSWLLSLEQKLGVAVTESENAKYISALSAVSEAYGNIRLNLNKRLVFDNLMVEIHSEM